MIDYIEHPPHLPRPMTIRELVALTGVESKHTELDHGVLRISKPVGIESSGVSIRVTIFLSAYTSVRQLGEITGATGGYILSRDPDTVLAPDVGFVHRDRIPPDGLPWGFFDGAPDLAVEVMSPTECETALRDKAMTYIAAGSRLVWVIDVWCRSATIYAPEREPVVIDETGTLDGENVVPGFSVALTKVLPRV